MGTTTSFQNHRVNQTNSVQNLAITPKIITTATDTTYTLTNVYEGVIIIQGSATGCSFVLPNATTCFVGLLFKFINISSQPVTIKYNDSSTLIVLPHKNELTIQCSAIGTTNGTWIASALTITGGSGDGQWTDIWSADVTSNPGNAAPDKILVPGYTSIYAYGFNGSSSIVEALSMTFELQHDYVEGTDLYPHVHWCGSSTAAGNVKWYFCYALFKTNNEGLAETTLNTGNITQPGLGANGRPIMSSTEFSAAISGTGLKVGDMIRATIYRDPSTDTYNDDAILLQCGIHYLANSYGSNGRFTK